MKIYVLAANRLNEKHAVSKIKIVGLLFCFLICSCSVQPMEERDTEAYWLKHKSEYIQLSEDMVELYKNTGITRVYRDKIGLDIKSKFTLEQAGKLFPQHEKKIRVLTSKMRELDITMSTGKGYVQFFLKSGGVLGSDTFLVHIIEKDGLENFKKDFKELGYTVLSTEKVEENWLYVNTS